MAAFKTDIALVQGWNRVTTAAVAGLRAQLNGVYAVRLQETQADSAPSSDAAGRAGAVWLFSQEGIAADLTVPLLWPGRTTSFIWAWADITGSTLSVAYDA